jgi:hypothetical protein
VGGKDRNRRLMGRRSKEERKKGVNRWIRKVRIRQMEVESPSPNCRILPTSPCSDGCDD